MASAARSAASAALAAQAAAEDALGPRSTGLELLADDPFEGIVISPTLEAAIQDVMPSEDELDRPDFAPSAYINKLFPTEESLLAVEPFMEELRGKIAALDAEIMTTVRLQTTGAGSARLELESGKAAIQQLFLRVQEVRRKADASEQMVHEICTDIKSLDYAKRNLTHTITALRRLQMLAAAVEQLRSLCSQRLYRECAHLLLAVAELQAHFEPFRSVPKVDKLHTAIAEIRQTLRTQIFADVNRLSTGADKADGPTGGGGADGGGGGGGGGGGSSDGGQATHSLDQLADACAAVDALGDDVRREMLSWFCNLTLAPYRHSFHPYADGGSLERTELRYTWHRQALHKYAQRYARVFPQQWCMAAVLSIEFCKVTRVHLAEILTEAGRAASLQVGALTHALTKTADFEKEMDALYGTQAASLANADGHFVAAAAAAAAAARAADAHVDTVGATDGATVGAGGRATGSSAASAAPTPPATGGVAGAASGASDGGGGAQPASSWHFVGAISSAFTAYMGTYVSLEDKSAKEGVASVLAAESWRVGAELKGGPKETRVLKSSIDLFLVIKRALKRCVPVSTGTVLLQLHAVWRAALCSYAAAVCARLPRLPPTSTGLEPPAVHLSDDELELVCAVVTTCEYCSQTSGELEESIRKHIDPALSAQVEMAAAQDAFQGAISLAVRLLVADVETSLHPHVAAYTRVKWAEMPDVCEESVHMSAVLRKLAKVCEFWGAHLLPIYVRFTCDKLVCSFMPRFLAMVQRCKRLGEIGAQQLLLDLQALKGALLELPTSCGASSTSAYTKMVSAEVGKAEQLLRLVLTPEDALAEHFSELAAGLAGAGGIGLDLTRVLELKGVRRPEMATSAISLLEELKEGVKGGVSSSAANASISQGSQKIKKLLNIS